MVETEKKKKMLGLNLAGGGRGGKKKMLGMSLPGAGRGGKNKWRGGVYQASAEGGNKKRKMKKRITVIVKGIKKI